MEKCQSRQRISGCGIERLSGCLLGRPSEQRTLKKAKEHGGDVGAVMRQMVAVAGFLFELAPRVVGITAGCACMQTGQTFVTLDVPECHRQRYLLSRTCHTRPLTDKMRLPLARSENGRAHVEICLARPELRAGISFDLSIYGVSG